MAGGKLRGGRHGLPRSVVRGNQRRRILGGVVSAAGELGYTRMTVESVIARAQVSRRTFYEHFRNKEEAFLAAYDRVMDGVLKRMSVACEAASAGRFEAGLRAFLESLAADPRAARMCVVEVPAAGPEAMRRQDAVLRALTGLLAAEMRRSAGARSPDLAAELTVNALYGVVLARVETGRAAELPDLVPALVPDPAASR
ncbi:TetR/AcrR family transcriptional regulator [Actinomadura vinacea]|uniref:TetR/AcrR family transcriptional regulator n=1 Tax=Actinomadura vinacea TaxID=115336 RepID=A0ABN3JC69_9ACTN